MKRNNHTVPKFYLAGFADEKKQIRRTLLETPERAGNVSISSATVLRDFYLVQEEDGTWSDRIEDGFLGKIESNGAIGFRAILDGREWPISKKARHRVSRWVALQDLRGPAQRQALDELVDISFKLDVAVEGRDGIRKWLNHNAEVAATEEEIDEMFADFSDTSAYKVSAPPNEHVRAIVENLEEVTLSMYVRPWNVVSFHRKSLATCDHPVVMVPKGDRTPVGPLNTPGVFVPLDRWTALVMGELPADPEQVITGADDVRFGGNALLANSFNGMLIGNAREAIFTHPDDAHLTQGALPLPRRQEVVPPNYKVWREAGEKIRSGKANLVTPSIRDLPGRLAND